MDIYEVLFDEETADIDIFSMVGNPAVKREFLRFSEQTPEKLLLKDNERMILTGVALIPDMVIERVDKSGYKFGIVFPCAADVVQFPFY